MSYVVHWRVKVYKALEDEANYQLCTFCFNLRPSCHWAPQLSSPKSLTLSPQRDSSWHIPLKWKQKEILWHHKTGDDKIIWHNNKYRKTLSANLSLLSLLVIGCSQGRSNAATSLKPKVFPFGNQRTTEIYREALLWLKASEFSLPSLTTGWIAYIILIQEKIMDKLLCYFYCTENLLCTTNKNKYLKRHAFPPAAKAHHSRPPCWLGRDAVILSYRGKWFALISTTLRTQDKCKQRCCWELTRSISWTKSTLKIASERNKWCDNSPLRHTFKNNLIKRQSGPKSVTYSNYLRLNQGKVITSLRKQN